VLPIRRAGRTDDGRVYFARDWVSGESLEALLARRRPDPLRAMMLIRSLCRALGEVHAAGVVHRNLHPGAILIERTVPRRLRLTGFDLASGPSRDPFVPELANPGLFVAGFRAPELARGEPSDARADLYSLGVIAYILLTGERPFDPADDALRGRALRPPRSLAPGLSPEVDVLVELLLADEPRHRPRRPSAGCCPGWTSRSTSPATSTSPISTARSRASRDRRPCGAGSAGGDSRPESVEAAPRLR
jgi:serine/threonine-protein kinase